MTDYEAFGAATETELAFLAERHGFQLVEQEHDRVRFESEGVCVVVTASPRGEVELRVSRIGDDDPLAELTHVAMVGRASIDRVVEILANRLREEPRAIAGDRRFFEQLRKEQAASAKAWTAYYSGTGPRPETGKLP